MDAIRKTYFLCVVFWLMLRDVWRHIAELHLITELFCSIVFGKRLDKECRIG